MAASGIQIMQALSSLKTANDALKYLRSVDAKFDKAELKVKYAELADVIADAREKLLEAKDEIEALQARIKDLEAVQDVRSKLIHRDNVYFIREKAGEEGPFCTRCYVKDSILMPLLKLEPAFRELGEYKCPDCKTCF